MADPSHANRMTRRQRWRAWTLGTRGRVVLGIFAAVLVVVLLVVPALRRLERQGLMEISELGALAPLWLGLIYLIAPLLFLPVMPLDLAAGAHFGFWQGVLWVQTAATASSVLGYLCSRTILGGLVQRLHQRRPELHQLDQAVAEEGLKILILCRLSSVFPFSLVNLLFGTSGIPFWKYVVASFVGMLPGTLMTVYAGDLAGDLSGAPGHPRYGTVERALLIGGFIATAAVVVYVTRKAQGILQAALKTAEATGDPPADSADDSES